MQICCFRTFVMQWIRIWWYSMIFSEDVIIGSFKDQGINFIAFSCNEWQLIDTCCEYRTFSCCRSVALLCYHITHAPYFSNLLIYSSILVITALSIKFCKIFAFALLSLLPKNEWMNLYSLQIQYKICNLFAVT